MPGLKLDGFRPQDQLATELFSRLRTMILLVPEHDALALLVPCHKVPGHLGVCERENLRVGQRVLLELSVLSGLDFLRQNTTQ